MKIILTCLISLMFCFKANSQLDCDCYERLKNLSEYANAIEDYPEANKLLLKALSYKNQNNWDRLDYKALAVSFSKIKDYKNCEKYLSEAIATGYSIASIKKLKDLVLFKQTSYWNQFLLKSDNLKKSIPI